MRSIRFRCDRVLKGLGPTDPRIRSSGSGLRVTWLTFEPPKNLNFSLHIIVHSEADKVKVLRAYQKNAKVT